MPSSPSMDMLMTFWPLVYSYDIPLSQHIHECHNFKITEAFFQLILLTWFLCTRSSSCRICYHVNIYQHLYNKKCEFPVSLSSKNEKNGRFYRTMWEEGRTDLFLWLREAVPILYWSLIWPEVRSGKGQKLIIPHILPAIKFSDPGARGAHPWIFWTTSSRSPPSHTDIDFY